MNLCWCSDVAGTPRSQSLNLAYRQPSASGALGIAHAKFGILYGEESAAVSSGQLSFFDPILNGRFQFQQANGIRDGGTVLAGALGNRFLRELEFVHEPLKSPCRFNGVQVFSLDVFDQRHFQRKLIWNIADNCRDFGQPGTLSRAPAAFASDQLKTRPNGANNQRLNDAAGLNRAGELVESLLPETCARLKRAGIDEISVDLERATGLRGVPCWGYRCAARCGGVRRDSWRGCDGNLRFRLP